jgi:ABC-type antimicrobial peptide transport system permease subunit
MQHAVRSGDPEQAIRQLTTLGALLDKTLFMPRLQTVILTLFAACSSLLAVVGLYGLVAAWVAERTREIGVRVALGAEGHDLLWLVIRQGMVLVGLGIGLGLLVSVALTRFLASLLYEVKPLDPTVLVAAAFGFTVVAFVANALPAWRATRVDPVVALAAE